MTDRAHNIGVLLKDWLVDKVESKVFEIQTHINLLVIQEKKKMIVSDFQDYNVIIHTSLKTYRKYRQVPEIYKLNVLINFTIVSSYN